LSGTFAGEAILLSPGTASFDEFDNFMHRGKVFAQLAVKKWEGESWK
jgi:UDP-N-acetylmuramoylalanine-D-glutamate ligase